MPKSADFKKIHARFVSQFGSKKGDEAYFAWVNKHKYDDTKSLSSQKKSKERKEKRCIVNGLEIKENDSEFHVKGLIATSHIDSLDQEEGIDISDVVPVETLNSFADQINTRDKARKMGVHHSEGHPFCAEYFGEADVDNYPAEVIELNDGKYGLFVDTKLLKNDPKTPELIEGFKTKELNSFSITYDTKNFLTTDFDFVEDKLVRVLLPNTELWGYTAASNPVNANAVVTDFGFKEFKELVKTKEGGSKMPEEKKEEAAPPKNEVVDKKEEKVEETVESPDKKEDTAEEKPEESGSEEEKEQKEFAAFKKNKATLEKKAFIEKTSSEIAKGVLEKMEVKEKVLKTKTDDTEKKIPLELKEFRDMIEKPDTVEVKEQFRRAAAVCDAINLDWRTATTSPIESREFKSFRTNGTRLEFKGLGITTNQNTDTDYLQSGAELQDVYDPVIYNALNQDTVTWNLLSKDDFSGKGNNQVQFTLKTAANTSAAFYTGNSVSTGNVTRLKFQTKFKKVQVGVSVDGDMIAAARGGPVGDVFAQEVMDSAIDMLAVVNTALFAEAGLETVAAVIGFEYIADSAGNTTLYNLTRSTTNRLSPDSAGDTYIDGASAQISNSNLRSMKRQAVLEGANQRNLVFITNPVQADIYRTKMDDARRVTSPRDTSFGFSTDLFFDGIPIFEDKDCNTDDWFCVDLETHRIAMWMPPSIERLGKSADSEDAFIKMYFAVYNRAPRRLGMCYSNATS